MVCINTLDVIILRLLYFFLVLLQIFVLLRRLTPSSLFIQRRDALGGTGVVVGVRPGASLLFGPSTPSIRFGFGHGSSM